MQSAAAASADATRASSEAPRDAGVDSGYSESYYARFHFGWSELRAVRTRRWHFIEAPTPELLRLSASKGPRIAADLNALGLVLLTLLMVVKPF